MTETVGDSGAVMAFAAVTGFTALLRRPAAADAQRRSATATVPVKHTSATTGAHKWDAPSDMSVMW